MTQVFNVYCDESCHLEHDRQSVMVLGAIWSPLEKTREIARSIRDIKERHGLRHAFEIKWTKVSPRECRGLILFLESKRDTWPLSPGSRRSKSGS